MRWLMLMLSFIFVSVMMVGSTWAAGPGASGNQARPMLQCQQRFTGMDTNNDGKVTQKEFMAAPHGRSNPQQVFESMAQGKNYITSEEFCANKGRHGGGYGGRGKGSMQ